MSIAKGTITSLNTQAAEKAPGVPTAMSHFNSQKVPVYDAGENPARDQLKVMV